MEIPISYATDKNNCLQVRVSMESVMKNINTDVVVNFYVLCNHTVDDIGKNIIANINNSYNNCTVKFIDTKDSFEGAYNALSNEGVASNATYFRLLLPEYLENYNTCIYLDADTIVCEDLSKLFNKDINEYYVCGVKDIAVVTRYQKSDPVMIDMCKTLNVDSLDSYINAGVLYMNLDKMRKDNISHKFMECIKYHFRFQDQDIINKVLFGKIVLLEMRYNSRVDCDRYFSDFLISEQEKKAALENPAIIHFAGACKPWENIGVRCGEIWWDYFYEMKDIDYVLSYNGLDIIKKINKKMRVKKNAIQNIVDIFSGTKPIYVYGAGDYGRFIGEYILKGCDLFKGYIITGESQDDDVYKFNDVKAQIVKENAVIFICVMEFYQAEIIDNLKNEGIKDYIVMNSEVMDILKADLNLL